MQGRLLYLVLIAGEGLHYSPVPGISMAEGSQAGIGTSAELLQRALQLSRCGLVVAGIFSPKMVTLIASGFEGDDIPRQQRRCKPDLAFGMRGPSLLG